MSGLARGATVPATPPPTGLSWHPVAIGGGGPVTVPAPGPVAPLLVLAIGAVAGAVAIGRAAAGCRRRRVTWDRLAPLARPSLGPGRPPLADPRRRTVG